MIKAPYNFVPLSRNVYFPEWRDEISHDVPFKNGVSGIIECSLSNTTPIYIRNGGKWSHDDIKNKPEAQSFFSANLHGQKRYIIPGTSIKGMLRSVLAIASFGKMQNVNDFPYSIRDLSGAARDVYRNKMTVGDEKSGYRPLPSSGWIRKDEKGYFLRKCEYARVEQNDLIALHPGDPDIKVKQSAKQKIAKWGGGGEVDFKLLKNETHQHNRIKLIYRKVDSKSLKIKAGGSGRIVFTGQAISHTFAVNLRTSVSVPEKLEQKLKYQPKKNKLQWLGNMSDADKKSLRSFAAQSQCSEVIENLISCYKKQRGCQKHTKHMEFIFYERSQDEFIVNPDKIEEFDFIHSTEDKQPNEEWSYWKSKLEKGDEMPVFYLGSADAPTSLGLSLMYRLPYDNSAHQAVCHTSQDHFSDIPDLADCIFGYAKKEGALKGRVAISHALETKAESENSNVPREAVFGSPKPTYYPNYIEQNVDNNGTVGKYKTFMDFDCKVRGWKRYPAQKSLTPLDVPPKAKDNDAVKTWFTPLKEGAQFSFKVRFHNLLPEELGALIWTLTWGGDETLRHSLGMGKAYGFGQVKIAISSVSCTVNDKKNNCTSDSQDLCNKFLELMKEGVCNDWYKTPQIVQLLGMADPTLEPDGTTQVEKLRHMKIQGVNGNEFVNAKGNERRKEPKLCLQPHVKFDGIEDSRRFENLKATGKSEKLKQASRQMTLGEKYEDSGNLEKLLNVFSGLKENDIDEVNKLDFSKRKDILNIGAVDSLLKLEISEDCKKIICCQVLANIKPIKNWSDAKKYNYERLKHYTQNDV